MADDIIIFGGYALTFNEFKIIFDEWYQSRRMELLKELETNIIAPLEKMIKVSVTVSSDGSRNATVLSSHGTAQKIKGAYDAGKIMMAWENLSQKFFGNGQVSLIAAAKFGNEEYSWTNMIPESRVVQPGGIAIRKRKFQNLLSEEEQRVSSVYAAMDVQDYLNNHYKDLLKTLGDYCLNKNEALAMHQLLETRKSNLNNVNFHFTGSTYDKIVFNSQNNAEGKRLDAFMNHVGKYNKILFSLMTMKRVTGKSLENIDLDEHSFNSIFPRIDEVQPWLLDSLNSSSWLSGGDIIVVDDTGMVIYNIQLKSTGKGKTFDLASSRLFTLAEKMRQLLEEDDPEQLAKTMFTQLKTSTANEFTRTEEFFKEKIYEEVKKNLNLKN